MRSAESFYASLIKVRHRSRCFGQWICRPDIGIIGSYHGGNFGDMSLGNTVSDILSARKNAPSHGLQTIYNLENWPSTRKGIVGGGAVAYRQSLANLNQRFGRRPQDLVFLGVDFNDVSVIYQYKEFLKSVFAITCRSQDQANFLGDALERSDVRAHPDLTFARHSLQRDQPPPPHHRERDTRRPICGLSIPSLMFARMNNSWVLNSHFSDEILQSAPSAGGNMRSLANAYLAFYRKASVILLQQGYALEHVPFAAGDDGFARHVLDGLPVRFLPYRQSYRSVISAMHRHQLFLSGRFHSLVFALKERVPCVAFCYSPKSKRLLNDLQVASGAIAELDEIVGGISEAHLCEMVKAPLILSDTLVANLSAGVRDPVNEIMNRWGI